MSVYVSDFVCLACNATYTIPITCTYIHNIHTYIHTYISAYTGLDQAMSCLPHNGLGLLGRYVCVCVCVCLCMFGQIFPHPCTHLSKHTQSRSSANLRVCLYMYVCMRALGIHQYMTCMYVCIGYVSVCDICIYISSTLVQLFSCCKQK